MQGLAHKPKVKKTTFSGFLRMLTNIGSPLITLWAGFGKRIAILRAALRKLRSCQPIQYVKASSFLCFGQVFWGTPLVYFSRIRPSSGEISLQTMLA
jgi:hypothetical protein